MECSFSLMDDRGRVLRECHRVLKPGGRVAIAVLYARGKPSRLKGSLGTIDSREGLSDLLERNQFTIMSFEDHTHALQTLWGQMIFDQGTTGFYESIATDREAMKSVRCGYCLMVASTNLPLP
jgi:SAM-dependent methyltransferase